MEKENKYDFRKLWYRLVDLNMTKQELASRAGISVSSLAKLKKGHALSYDRMKRICNAVNVDDFKDIMEEM